MDKVSLQCPLKYIISAYLQYPVATGHMSKGTTKELFDILGNVLIIT